MPVKIVRRDHFEVLGEGHVLLTAPHATVPEADLYTGHIVEDVALTSRSYAVVGKVSPEVQDPDRVQVAQTELRNTIDAMILDNGIRLLLDIHGKKDEGVDIRTEGTGTRATTELVRTRLAKTFAVTLNPRPVSLRPGSVIASYAREDAVGGFSVEALQLEFGQREREFQRDMVVNGLVEVVALLNLRLESEETSTE